MEHTFKDEVPSMSKPGKAPEQATEFHIQGLSGLSTGAARFIRRHPKQARMAVAAALEAAAVQYQAEEHATGIDIPEALRPFAIRKPPASDVIGVSEAAQRLQISRTTVYDWCERKKLLGWKSTKRGLRIPAEQIVGPGNVVSGISEVLEIIDDPELAWAFLSEQWPFADETARPIDKLRGGDVEEVVNAAPGFGTAVT